MKVLFVSEYLPQEMLGIMWLSRALKDAGHETKALFLPDTKWLDVIRAVIWLCCASQKKNLHLL